MPITTRSCTTESRIQLQKLYVRARTFNCNVGLDSRIRWAIATKNSYLWYVSFASQYLQNFLIIAGMSGPLSPASLISKVSSTHPTSTQKP
ncbi:unnamed protein product, partial [Dicrocoelium dendriticum]